MRNRHGQSSLVHVRIVPDSLVAIAGTYPTGLVDERVSRREDAPMPDILSSYAAATPDKLAVIDDRPGETVRSWTFAELEDRANRLANVLLDHGVTPGTKVVWCGQNSAP